MTAVKLIELLLLFPEEFSTFSTINHVSIKMTAVNHDSIKMKPEESSKKPPRRPQDAPRRSKRPQEVPTMAQNHRRYPQDGFKRAQGSNQPGVIKPSFLTTSSRGVPRRPRRASKKLPKHHFMFDFQCLLELVMALLVMCSRSSVIPGCGVLTT